MNKDELPGYEFGSPRRQRHANDRRPESGRQSVPGSEFEPDLAQSEFGRGPVPGAEFGRGPVPGSEFGYRPVPGAEFGRGPVPGSEFGRGPAPRSEFDRGPVPGAEFGRGWSTRPEVSHDSIEFGRGPAPRTGPGRALVLRSEFGRDLAPQTEFSRQPFRGFSAPLLESEPAEPEQPDAGRGLLDIMRQRNWILGLAAPVVAAIAVGIAVVVATGGGGNGGTAPSTADAGFAPARLAGASFTGSGGKTQVDLHAVAASGQTEVTVGNSNGDPALWTSQDGGEDFTRATLSGNPPPGQLVGVAHGQAGWLAVGAQSAAGGQALVASSVNAGTWTLDTGFGKGSTAAVAAGPAGYVIVGQQSVAGSSTAAAWYSPDLTGFQPATITVALGPDTQMNAVTATAHGFTAVGALGTEPAAWVSPTGKTWQEVPVPPPFGATRSALKFVAANGSTVVAAGTEFSATGAGSPFAEESANGGETWTEIQLPVPGASPSTAAGPVSITSTPSTLVTALTAAGGGFTAAGTYQSRVGPEVVIWTLPPGAQVTDASAWMEDAPLGTGLSTPNSVNELTGLTVDGVTLNAVGFTAPPPAAGGSGQQQQPTLWQSTVRP